MTKTRRTRPYHNVDWVSVVAAIATLEGMSYRPPTCSEVAEYMQLPYTTIYSWVRKLNQLGFVEYKVGKRRRLRVIRMG